MKISALTIVTFLSIACARCVVNADDMIALTNNMSRRRHLDDSPCNYEDLFKCLSDNAYECGYEGEGARKLGRDSRFGSSYSLSNGHHGRHLEDNVGCEDYQSNICGLLEDWPSCPCIANEHIPLLECLAEDEGLSCDEFSVDACDDIPSDDIPPCKLKDDAFEQCLDDNEVACELDDEGARKLGRDSRSGSSYFLSDGHHGRHLDHDYTSCEDYQSDICDEWEDWPSCPCIDECISTLECLAEDEGLSCDEFSVDACDDISCNQEDILQCLEDNAADCDEGARKLGRDSRSGSSYSLSNGHHGRHLEDHASCDYHQFLICDFESWLPSCPCIDEVITYEECAANKRGLSCDDFSVDACDDISCNQEDILLWQCLDECELDDEGARKLGRDSGSGSSYSLSNGHHGRHLEDDSAGCDDFQTVICDIVSFFPLCPCEEELVATLDCYDKDNDFFCEDLSVNVCDDTAGKKQAKGKKKSKGKKLSEGKKFRTLRAQSSSAASKILNSVRGSIASGERNRPRNPASA